jgi:hypothetical protein
MSTTDTGYAVAPLTSSQISGLESNSPGIGWQPGVGYVVPGATTASSTTVTSNPYAMSVPAGMVANPYITTPQLGQPGSSPVAMGVDLMRMMLDSLFNAERLRQSGVDQTVSIARLFADLERASPTRAADLAVSLGIPGLQPDLSVASRFHDDSTSGIFGGRVGTQDVRLPFAFSGKELSFLGNNPNVANVLTDIADRFGRPDIMKTSLDSLIPASGNLFKF